MRIFDCFMYYDEDLVLDIRLNTLKNFVDRFVIVESNFFHSGKRRNLNLILTNFPNLKIKLSILFKTKNQIIYIS